MADQISDGVLDAVLGRNPTRPRGLRDAGEHRARRRLGRITTESYVDIPKIARETIRKIGYHGGQYGFDCESCAVITAIDEQSPTTSPRAWNPPTSRATTPPTRTRSTRTVPATRA